MHCSRGYSLQDTRALVFDAIHIYCYLADLPADRYVGRTKCRTTRCSSTQHCKILSIRIAVQIEAGHLVTERCNIKRQGQLSFFLRATHKGDDGEGKAMKQTERVARTALGKVFDSINDDFKLPSLCRRGSTLSARAPYDFLRNSRRAEPDHPLFWVSG